MHNFDSFDSDMPGVKASLLLSMLHLHCLEHQEIDSGCLDIIIYNERATPLKFSILVVDNQESIEELSSIKSPPTQFVPEELEAE